MAFTECDAQILVSIDQEMDNFDPVSLPPFPPSAYQVPHNPFIKKKLFGNSLPNRLASKREVMDTFDTLFSLSIESKRIHPIRG